MSSSVAKLTEIVLQRLSELVDQKSSGEIEEQVLELDKNFSAYACTNLDYDALALGFAYRYFWQNFRKAVVAFRDMDLANVRTVLDVGAGSAACTLALLVSLEERSGPLTEMHVVLVDKSQAHLAIGEALIRAIAPELRRIKLRTEYISQKFGTIRESKFCADLILVGHMLNESPEEVPSILGFCKSSLSELGQIVIMDRPSDPVWKVVQESCFECGFEWHSSLALGSEKEKMTRTMILRQTKNPQILSLINEYIQAWQNRSIEAIGRIFDSSAIYKFKPFHDPLRGVSEIKDYWRSHVLTQEHPEIFVSTMVFDGSLAWLEWTARFARGQSCYDVEGYMSIRSTQDIQRIAELREAYRTRTESHCANI